MTSDAAAVLVSVRIKPPSVRSFVTAQPGGSIHVESQKHGGSVVDGFASITDGSDQMDAYEAVARPLVDRLMQGYSCTLMAYGQTGSGKTHTIFGPPGCLMEAALQGSDNTGASSAPVDWGLFPRVALELLASGKGALHASAVEVYQERAFDLLADRAPLVVGTQKVGEKVATAGKDAEGKEEVHKSTCKCRECYLRKEQALKDRKAGLAVRRSAPTKTDSSAGGKGSSASAGRIKPAGGAPARVGSGAAARGGGGGGGGDTSFATVGETLQPLRSAADVARLARTIEHTRTAVAHLLNARSSRSHCLVHLHLTEAVAGGGVSRRQLLFVDLAGSERILKTGAEGVAAQQVLTPLPSPPSQHPPRAYAYAPSSLARHLLVTPAFGLRHVPRRSPSTRRSPRWGRWLCLHPLRTVSPPDHRCFHLSSPLSAHLSPPLLPTSPPISPLPTSPRISPLEQVVRAVGARQAHVPYRDSTLTQLLRSSLSGASRGRMLKTRPIWPQDQPGLQAADWPSMAEAWGCPGPRAPA